MKSREPDEKRPKGLVNRSLEHAIGNQVRLYRKNSGMTVAELATAGGISPGMQSKIENGQISPSLSTLQTLAVALNIPISVLFTGGTQQHDCSFVRAGDRIAVKRRGDHAGKTCELLGHSLDGALVVEPTVIKLTKEPPGLQSARNGGIEFVFVISGEFEYTHGQRKYTLKPGDALMFDTAAAHGAGKIFEGPVSYLSVATYFRR